MRPPVRSGRRFGVRPPTWPKRTARRIARALPRTASAARLAPFLLVVGLLGATAAAFAVTEGLKLEPSPIRGTEVDKIFSPDVRVAHIRFRLRKADRLTLVIVDSRNRVVRTLIAGRRFNRGLRRFTWNGRGDAGEVVRDGAYRPRVHLGAQHRTILLPNPITVDTRPPTAVLTIRSREITPGRSKIKAFYRLSEPAHAILYANGKRVVGPSRFYPLTGKLDWYANGFKAGAYRLSLRAVDLAGNLGPATRSVTIRIVYLELARHRLHAAPGGALAVRFRPIDTARWLLNGHTGVARHGRLRIKAPDLPGTYTLYVRSDGHADRATVIVG
jgi:FlgD Ig-like domain